MICPPPIMIQEEVNEFNKKSPPVGRHKKRTWQLAIVASSHYRHRYDA